MDALLVLASLWGLQIDRGYTMTPFALIAAPIALLAAQGLSSDLQRQYDRLAVAYSMAGTCQNYGYEVDAAGLAEWKVAAVDRAVEGGMDREGAQERLDRQIERQTQKIDREFQGARRSGGNSAERFNRKMKKSCHKISEDDMTGGYFYPPE